MAENSNKAFNALIKIMHDTEQIKKSLSSLNDKIDRQSTQITQTQQTPQTAKPAPALAWNTFLVECRKRLVPNMTPKQLSDMCKNGCEIQFLVAISGYTDQQIRSKVTEYNKSQLAKSIANKL